VAAAPASAVVVTSVPATPPPPTTEASVASVSPGSEYVWVKVYYNWDGSRYEWVPGTWVRTPSPSVVWVPAHWQSTNGGYICATAPGRRISLRSRTSTSKSPAAFFTCNRSPTRTSREALACCPLDTILPSSQARRASARVLKNRAAQSHLSVLRRAMIPFSYV